MSRERLNPITRPGLLFRQTVSPHGRKEYLQDLAGSVYSKASRLTNEGSGKFITPKGEVFINNRSKDESGKGMGIILGNTNVVIAPVSEQESSDSPHFRVSVDTSGKSFLPISPRKALTRIEDSLYIMRNVRRVK